MRCPKCHYLSFEPEPRCKNCGFDLSVPDADLALKADEAEVAPPTDLALHAEFAAVAAAPAVTAARTMRHVPAAASERQAPNRPARRSAPPASAITALLADDDEQPSPEPAPMPGDPLPEEVQAVLRRAESRPAPTTELPLFVRGLPSDAADTSVPAASMSPFATLEPIVAESAPTRFVPPAPAPVVARAPFVPDTPTPTPTPAPATPIARPRVDLDAIVGDDDADVLVPAAPPPLAVRRKAPDSGPQRMRAAVPPRKLGPLDRDLLEDLQRIEKQERRDAAAQARSDGRAADPAEHAGLGPRIAAAVIDGVFLGALLVGVMAITLRWCELPWQSAGILPIAPTAAFLLLIAAGYLAMFTAAGGQTIGKMLAGLRVVRDAGADAADDAPLTLGQAVSRSLLALPSVLVLGAGFVPALLGDRRTLHDRLSHTRVVRA